MSDGLHLLIITGITIILAVLPQIIQLFILNGIKKAIKDLKTDV